MEFKELVLGYPITTKSKEACLLDIVKWIEKGELSDHDYEVLGANYQLLHAYALQLNLNGKYPLFFANDMHPDFKKYLSELNYTLPTTADQFLTEIALPRTKE